MDKDPKKPRGNTTQPDQGNFSIGGNAKDIKPNDEKLSSMNQASGPKSSFDQGLQQDDEYQRVMTILRNNRVPQKMLDQLTAEISKTLPLSDQSKSSEETKESECSEIARRDVFTSPDVRSPAVRHLSFDDNTARTTRTLDESVVAARQHRKRAETGGYLGRTLGAHSVEGNGGDIAPTNDMDASIGTLASALNSSLGDPLDTPLDDSLFGSSTFGVNTSEHQPSTTAFDEEPPSSESRTSNRSRWFPSRLLGWSPSQEQQAAEGNGVTAPAITAEVEHSTSLRPNADKPDDGAFRAELVDDAIEAQELDLDKIEHEHRSRFRRRTQLFTCIGLITIVAIIITIIIVSQLTRHQSNKDEPTTSPTVSPETRTQVIRSILSNITSSEEHGTTTGAFDVSGTAQHKALEWMMNEEEYQVDITDSNKVIQRYVLAVLFYSTNGETSWNDQFGFLTPEDECSWGGAIRCDDDDNIVTAIDLRENGLVGLIPDELSALSALEFIVFDSNDLTGTLPASFGGLTSLSRLDLWDNDLEGSFPAWFSSLTKLESLRLGLNAISGSIPSEIGMLTKLTVLSLERNLLTGFTPDEMWNLTNMEYFDAQRQLLSGTVSPKIGEWQNLTHFAYLRLNITGTVPSELGKLTKLTNLQLGANKVWGTVPSELGNLGALWKLSLSHNGLTGTFPREYLQMTSLEEIYMQNTRLVDDVDFICDAIDRGEFGPLSVHRFDLEEVNCTCCTCCAY